MRLLRSGSAAGFAAAMASRHGPVGGRPSRAALLLLRPRLRAVRLRPMGSHSIHHRWSVRVSLGLRQVLHVAGGLPDRELQLPVALNLRYRKEQPSDHRKVPSRDREVLSRMRMPLVLSGLRSRMAPPLPLVVRRRSVDQPAAAPTISPPAAATPRVRQLATPGPSGFPAGELDRVADHVLKSLDRRMSSWRERRGKA